MHWTPNGAQAMLDVRSIHVSDEWEQYQEYRIESKGKPYNFIRIVSWSTDHNIY
jgi:hypothetical protein